TGIVFGVSVSGCVQCGPGGASVGTLGRIASGSRSNGELGRLDGPAIGSSCSIGIVFGVSVSGCVQCGPGGASVGTLGRIASGSRSNGDLGRLDGPAIG
ncbi:spore wall protein-1, partial [Stereum hirsutum FP-91666 SS1]|uniref:spore wall protein-1 n=1 Tax=Stereum hirsutum (strain FP-91666) TaxID=721885 RepID=UPI000444A1F1